MVTSCKWQQMKLLTPQGYASKVVYLMSQVGRQQLELAGKAVTTTFSTQAARLEFVTIQEALFAQRPPQEEELTAQFVRCEEALLDGAMQLKPPFDPDNISNMELVVAPFVIYYFSISFNTDGTEGPVTAIPVSLFNGRVADKLTELLCQFPLTASGEPTIISPNISLEEAFHAAATKLEATLSNAEIGKSSLIWCDIAKASEQHRRTYRPQDGTFTWEHLQWEESQHQVLGLQPVEYLNPALILVPHLILTLREPVQGATTGLLDPVLQNVYLMMGDVSVEEM